MQAKRAAIRALHVQTMDAGRARPAASSRDQLRAQDAGTTEGKMKGVVLLASEKHVCTGFEAARDT